MTKPTSPATPPIIDPIGIALDAVAGEEVGAGVEALEVDEFTTKVPLGSPFLFKLLLRSDWS